jgi:2-polyprenyl-6-methoxyphenol hydroxylase-like FAD-dependent oxidoreductase
MRPLSIAIVGCGTAGAASALFLSAAGHDVHVLERVPDPGPVGAGIMMQPSGLMVLERLGCADAVLERGALVCRTTSGKTVMDLHYADLEEGLFGVGLHRGVLFETLYAAVLRSRARLWLGADAIGAKRTRGGGHVLTLADGRRLGPFDLVVLCDGARSQMRDALDMTRSVRPYPWGALWLIAECAGPGRELRQWVQSTHTMIGMLPTGLGPGEGSRPLVSLFYSVRADRLPALLSRGLPAWKDEVRAAAPPAAELLDRVDDFGQLTFASYYDVAMPRWHASGVVVLGDAAHATSPQLGQGCNLALCDAEALADAVAQATRVDEALELYTRSRREHLAYYQLATRALTPFFQSDASTLGWLRDTLMPISTRVGFVRREMVRSMAGTKTGWLQGTRETRMPSTCRSPDP